MHGHLNVKFGGSVFSIRIVQWAGKLRNIGLIPARDKSLFFLSITSRTAATTEPPIQEVPGLKRLGREADHFCPSPR
jgi:hypothetical protein